MKNLLEQLEELRVKLEDASSGALGAEDLLSDATREAEELDDEEELKEELVDETEEMYDAVSSINYELGEMIEKLENLIAKIKGE